MSGRTDFVTTSAGNSRPVVTIGDPTTPGSVAAVKAASTAPLATDPAMVVTLSPNSTVTIGAQISLAGATPYNTAANTAGHAVSSAPGVFCGLTVNPPGVGSTATLYDGASTAGTKLATVATTAQVSLTHNIALTTGLFMVLAGGTPADVTVTYR